jgi:predicted nucleic acid-binding protein
VNIYVESNFVLEVALAQEQHESCESILALCAANRAQLLIPAFSIAEPYQTLERRHRQRRQTKRELDSELTQLARTAGYAQSLSGAQSLVDLLIDSTDEEARRLEATRAKLIQTAAILPLDATVLSAATPYQAEYDLSPEDAIVYATVVAHLKTSPSEASCFLNRNTRDFDDPDLVAELRRLGCKLLPRFDSGYQYILASLKPDEGADC